MKYLAIIFILIHLYAGHSQTVSKTETICPRYHDKTFDAIIQVETQWLHRRDGHVVTSDAGAIGIAQIMPNTLAYYNMVYKTRHLVYDLYDREFNLRIGYWYWKICQGDISSYNMGVNNDKKNLGYVRRVKECVK